MIPVGNGPYFTWIEYPALRVRTEFEVRRGDVQWFVVQLEYNNRPDVPEADDWRQVARFDHEPTAPAGHDVTEEGLHMDLYRSGEKVDVKRDFPDVPLSEAVQFCESYLVERRKDLLTQYDL